MNTGRQGEDRLGRYWRQSGHEWRQRLGWLHRERPAADIVALVNAERCVLSIEPRHGGPGPADSQKTTVGVDFSLREQTKVEPDLRDASPPTDTRRRDTAWWRRAEFDLRPDKPVEIIVVQYDGVAIQRPDILGGCFRPSEGTAQIDRHRRYRDCS